MWVTKYSPDLPEKYLSLAKEGKSPVQIGAALYCSPQMFYQWANEYSDMKEALELGKILQMAKYEDYGEKGMNGFTKGWCAATFKYLTGVKFGWSEKHEISAADDKELTDEEITKRLAALGYKPNASQPK